MSFIEKLRNCLNFLTKKIKDELEPNKYYFPYAYEDLFDNFLENILNIKDFFLIKKQKGKFDITKVDN